MALVPGARGNPGNIQAGAAGGDMAKYQVDGVDVSGQCCGGSNQSYSQENISEFQVITNRFDAEHGRVGGAVINAVTKSGTNALRATGFGFFRDDAFDARNFYTGTVSPFHEEQMGLNGGGPILRDRMHFFGSYEYQQRAVTARTNTGIAQFDFDVTAGHHASHDHRARGLAGQPAAPALRAQLAVQLGTAQRGRGGPAAARRCRRA